jgi:phosphoribosylanthranilate isomerase
MKPLFRIKICGITSVEDAQAAAAAGADAIGLNFFSGSPRYVNAEKALTIRKALSSGVHCVGVFVNAPVADVAKFAADLNLDAIQIHGDEPPEYLHAVRAAGAWLTYVPIIRALMSGRAGSAERPFL